jgi:hypothetical protein
MNIKFILQDKLNFLLVLVSLIFIILVLFGWLQPWVLYFNIICGIAIAFISLIIIIRKLIKPVENEYPKTTSVKKILSVTAHILAIVFYLLVFLAYPVHWINNYYIETAAVSFINIVFVVFLMFEKRKWMYKLPEKITKPAYLASLVMLLTLSALILFNIVPSCPVSCDDSNECTIDMCSAKTNYQCENTVLLNCTGNGICEIGEYPSVDCPVCDDGNPCTSNNYEFTIGCYYNLTYDCLGNGICEQGEYPSQDCPSCDDNNSCTNDDYNFVTKRCDHRLIIPCDGNKICELGEYGLDDCSFCNSTAIFYYSQNECKYLADINTSGVIINLSSISSKDVRVVDALSYDISLKSVKYIGDSVIAHLSVNNVSSMYLGVDRFQYTLSGSKVTVIDINDENPSDMQVVIRFVPQKYRPKWVDDYNLIGILSSNYTKVYQDINEEKVHILDDDIYTVKIVKPCNSCGAGNVPQTRLKINGYASGDIKLGKSVVVDDYKFGIVGVSLSPEESYVEYYIRKI